MRLPAIDPKLALIGVALLGGGFLLFKSGGLIDKVKTALDPTDPENVVNRTFEKVAGGSIWDLTHPDGVPNDPTPMDPVRFAASKRRLAYFMAQGYSEAEAARLSYASRPGGEMPDPTANPAMHTADPIDVGGAGPSFD